MGGPHTDDELDTLLANGRLGAATKDRIEDALLRGAARPAARRRWQWLFAIAAAAAAAGAAIIALLR
jgi:hypothetical protein